MIVEIKIGDNLQPALQYSFFSVVGSVVAAAFQVLIVAVAIACIAQAVMYLAISCLYLCFVAIFIITCIKAPIAALYIAIAFVVTYVILNLIEAYSARKLNY